MNECQLIDYLNMFVNILILTKEHFFLSDPSVILYECNWRCRCHKQRCANRVIQKGIKVGLELFKHKDMGWGVRALQPISRGTFVCEYVY